MGPTRLFNGKLAAIYVTTIVVGIWLAKTGNDRLFASEWNLSGSLQCAAGLFLIGMGLSLPLRRPWLSLLIGLAFVPTVVFLLFFIIVVFVAPR